MAITDILSQISKAGGVARNNRFSVQIAMPSIFATSAQNTDQATRDQISQFASATGTNPQDYGVRPDYFRELGLVSGEMPSRLDFMCSKAELPSKAYSTSDNRTYGSYFKMPYVDTYSDITLHFIVGDDMKERHFFDAWSYTIQDPDTADFNYVDEYATVIDIYQMNDRNVSKYGVRFFQAWPVAIGTLTLDYDSRNAYHVLPVTFTYRKWINNLINTSTPTAIEPAGGAPSTFETTINSK